MDAASLGVIGTRLAFRPFAPPSDLTRSSALPRSNESSIRSDSPSGARSARPHSSDIRTPEPTMIRTATSSVELSHVARIWRTWVTW